MIVRDFSEDSVFPLEWGSRCVTPKPTTRLDSSESSCARETQVSDARTAQLMGRL